MIVLAGDLCRDRARGWREGTTGGDWAQLQSVDARGAFSMRAEARDYTPELVEVLRFAHEWEAAAFAGLRVGDAEVIGTYVRKGRVREGTADAMTDAAYDAWSADVQAGLSSVLVTEVKTTVTKLNQRARAERILTVETEAGREVELADGNRASISDLIITRRNQRRLRSLRGGWVQNGDRWRITDVMPNGSVLARRLDAAGAGIVVLPAGYVCESADLGYAITAHRAQGSTVDTAHAVASGATNRENLYVSMTRGRRSNTVYVALVEPDDAHTPPQEGDTTGRTVPYGILQRSGAELSAHQTIEAEQDQWSSIQQLAAEYETIAADAQRDRWVGLVSDCGINEADIEQLLTSESFGPLIAEFRRAEANGYDLDKLLPRLVANRGLADAGDVGAVLISRLHHATAQPRRIGRHRSVPKLIAGLILIADGPMNAEKRQALDERQHQMEQRTVALIEQATRGRDPCLTSLGPPPTEPEDARGWLAEIRIVVAYRDRYGLTGSRPLGPSPVNDAQRLDRVRARAALRRAEVIALADDRQPSVADPTLQPSVGR